MIVRGESTIIDYNAPFDQGFKAEWANIYLLFAWVFDTNLYLSNSTPVFVVLDTYIYSSFFLTSSKGTVYQGSSAKNGKFKPMNHSSVCIPGAGSWKEE